MKQLRIFIGPTEIANIGAILGEALKEMGIKVTVVCTTLNPHQTGMKYDKVLNFGKNPLNSKSFSGLFMYTMLQLKRLYHFLFFFFRHNAFIFIGSSTFLPRSFDLVILRLFRKKTVMWFMGSDLRDYDAIEAIIRETGIDFRQTEAKRDTPLRAQQKKKMVPFYQKYVDHIIAYPSIAQMLTKDYIGKKLKNRIYGPLDYQNIRFNNEPNQKPIVVHAPSSDARKGTSFILEAVERLKDEGYAFDFHLFRDVSNIEVRETLSRADIAVDQLFSPEPGMFAIEAMSAGCAVLSGNVPEIADNPPDLPVIHTNPQNVYQNLKLLLDKPELRKELGAKGREYVQKYHDAKKVAVQIVQILSGTIIH